jgi:hypothetical protein
MRLKKKESEGGETYLSSETVMIDSFSIKIAAFMSSGMPSILFSSSAFLPPLNLSLRALDGFISVVIVQILLIFMNFRKSLLRGHSIIAYGFIWD